MSTFQLHPALQFVWLTVSDLNRSVRFYSDTLKFPVQVQNNAFAIVQLGESALYLAVGEATPGNMHLAISVEDVDAFHQQLQAQGLPVTPPEDEGWARYINLLDPDGYQLLILTRTTL